MDTVKNIIKKNMYLSAFVFALLGINAWSIQHIVQNQSQAAVKGIKTKNVAKTASVSRPTPTAKFFPTPAPVISTKKQRKTTIIPTVTPSSSAQSSSSTSNNGNPSSNIPAQTSSSNQTTENNVQPLVVQQSEVTPTLAAQVTPAPLQTVANNQGNNTMVVPGTGSNVANSGNGNSSSNTPPVGNTVSVHIAPAPTQ